MNRKMKNIITSIVLVVALASTGFTIYSANNSVEEKTSNSTKISNNRDDRGGTPPNMNERQNNNSSSKKSKDSSNKKSKNTTSENTKNEVENNFDEPPAKPDDDEPNMDGGTPPEMPDGEAPNMDGGTPPEMPDGEAPNMDGGMPPEMQSNNENLQKSQKETNTKLSTKYYVLFSIEGLVIGGLVSYLIVSKANKESLKEIVKDKTKVAIVIISSALVATATCIIPSTIINNSNSSENNTTISENNNNNSNNKGGSSKTSYNAASEITEDKTITSGEYTSNTADENALSVSGDIDANISNIKVDKTGDSDGGDSTSFYGTNSAIIAKDGATLTIKNATISTDATGANGVFSYGGSATTNNNKSDGTTINISDSTITTKKGNSGGIMTTGGGTTNAKNLTITTEGQSSAAIRSDRGGGTVNVDGGTYTSNGVGSPAIYSTADITVKNAKLISTTSEGIIIEGKNSVTIDNVDLTDNHTKNVKSKTYKNIFIYQSMSGDAAEGEATFTAKNSTITTNNGDSFYISNTTATINLTNNKIINNDKSGYFLRAQADSWGKEGSNGGIVTLNMSNQTVTGNIGVDEISTLTMSLKDKSSYTGTINGDNKAKNISLKLDKNSKIKLTGDSYITSLDNEDSNNTNIDFNGYKLYYNVK